MIFFILLTLGLASSYAATPFSYCPKMTSGICTELYSTSPYIHTPPSQKSANGTIRFYGAIFPTSEITNSTVQARDSLGKTYVLVSKDGAPLDFQNSSAWNAKLKFPSYDYLFNLYVIQGKPITQNRLILKSIEPVLTIESKILDQFLLGEWQGSVSRRLLKPSGFGPFLKWFDEVNPVRIAMNFDSTSIQFQNGLNGWAGAPANPKQTGLKLKGKILNWNQPYTSKATGESFRALTDLGKEFSFLGAQSPAVELYKHTNMHGVAYDDHWVFTYPQGSDSLTTNGMSYRINSFNLDFFIAQSPKTLSQDRKEIKIWAHLPYQSNGHELTISPLKGF